MRGTCYLPWLWYGEDTATIVEHVLRTADVGVAGINIEDSLKQQKGLREVVLHSNLLSKIRAALDTHGFNDFFINARTDTYLQKDTPLLETIERANAYVESGASGIFVPGSYHGCFVKERRAANRATRYFTFICVRMNYRKDRIFDHG